MFTLCEDFSVCDDNKQPYSLETERHTAIDDLHARVENGEFAFHSIGNRFVVKTPRFSSFNVSLRFGFTSLYEFKPNFNLLFHYDKQARQGEGLRLVYNLDGTVTLSYILLDKMRTETVRSVTLAGITMTEGERYELSVSVSGISLLGTLCGQSFSFTVRDASGYIAIERKNYIGSWLIQKLTVTSNDAVRTTVLLPNVTVDIPLIGGGDIPYRLTWRVQQENEVAYAYITLSGGTVTRKKNKEDRPGQYAVERDTLTSPYVRFNSGEKIYFFNGQRILADPNIYWDCLKLYWQCPELPIEKKVAVSQNVWNEKTIVTYGYEEFTATGYMIQSLGAAEFVYDGKGALLYSGEALGESVYTLTSPADKKALSYIPEDCYEREAVLTHLKQNHYFAADEPISLTFTMKTKLNPEHIRVYGEIRDVYDSKTLTAFEPQTSCAAWLFGYSAVSCTIAHAPMAEGVYRAVFSVYYGDGLYERFGRVFEVYDEASSVSPAVASGLPYVFSMPNEQKWLSRNTFDLWNPMPSCDCEHYISAVTDTPIEAERKQVWRVLPPFKREWFAWLQNRTCRDWEMEHHMDVVRHSDYLYYPAPVELYPLRNDLYLLQTYTYNPEMRAYLREFLAAHPESAKKLSFTLPEEDNSEKLEMLVDETEMDRASCGFTYDNLKELLDLCHAEWFAFVLAKLHDNIVRQNQAIKAINPRFRRTAYGPFNQYVNCTLSYHTIRSFGMLPDETLSRDVYTGFAIFEDYPYSCAYQTYRGAFGVMTTLLHVPDLRLYPEQYTGSRFGGCIDGAVKFSHAPMGAYVVKPYMNATHAFEFVFNTPYRTETGYQYWNTYGFHRPDFGVELWDGLVRDWKYVLEYKPRKPLQTVAFAAEYTDREDAFDCKIPTLAGTASLANRSEQAHGYLYECARECGLNAGFAVKLETLQSLSAAECSILVLPTLADASSDVIREIRRLYKEGVSLVAVSDIPGLEDIFGVCEKRQTAAIDTLLYEDESEGVYPTNAELYYQAEGAEVLLSGGDGLPIVMRHNRTLLLNAAVTDLGYECFEGMAGKGRRSISRLLRGCLTKAMRALAVQPVLGENVGVTLFETEKGETALLAIDYTPFDNKPHGEHTAVVMLNMEKVVGAESDVPLVQVHNAAGQLCELRFSIKPHGFCFIKLTIQ